MSINSHGYTETHMPCIPRLWTFCQENVVAWKVRTMSMTMTMKIIYCQSCTGRNMWSIQYIWHHRMFKERTRWIITVVSQLWQWEQKWYFCGDLTCHWSPAAWPILITFVPRFVSTTIIQNKWWAGTECNAGRTLGENRIVNKVWKNKTGEKISNCIWKCLLHNQCVLHDIENSIILFHNVSELSVFFL